MQRGNLPVAPHPLHTLIGQKLAYKRRRVAMSPLLTQVGLLARRSVVRTFRQPANVVFAFFFPLLLLAVNVGGLDAAVRIPGFPSESFLDFALAFTFMQGALFATTNAGTDLARDIQTGFLNRLALTPLRGTALLAGQLAGIVVLGLAQSLLYLSVGLAAGARLEAGAAGVVVLLLLASLIATAFGAIGAFLALLTGSGEAVQGLFPLLFVLLFLSSMNLPRNLIEIDWFRTVATINPVSYLIEGLRSLIIFGWDAQALALAFGIGLGLAVAALGAASLALKGRLART
jgi:ABC-2 type transport system permease protein